MLVCHHHTRSKLQENKCKTIPIQSWLHPPQILATKSELISFVDMLSGTTAEVQAMKAKGLSLVQMQEKGLSDHWDNWAKGLLNAKTWIGLIDASL